MDPNETLRQLLATAHDLRAALEDGDGAPDASAVLDLVENALNLDAWIQRGGFLPECWEAKRR